LSQAGAHNRGLSIEETLSRFFGEAEVGYRMLVETAIDAIVVFDQDYRIIIWNPSAEKMFGYTKDETSGLSFTKLIGNSNDGVQTNGNAICFSPAGSYRKTKPIFCAVGRTGARFLPNWRCPGRRFPTQCSVRASSVI
jgi:PAS domain-containing protein